MGSRPAAVRFGIDGSSGTDKIRTQFTCLSMGTDRFGIRNVYAGSVYPRKRALGRSRTSDTEPVRAAVNANRKSSNRSLRYRVWSRC